MNTDQLEYTTPQDLYLNFLWWPYRPVAVTENKLRPVNLLFHSFDLAASKERAFRLVSTIREAIGTFRTVWGIKWLEGRIVWEFYFYDYKRQEREVSITRVLESIHPLVKSDLREDERIPYFMFSLDLSDDVFTGDRVLEEAHIYIANPGSTMLSGIAYSFGPKKTVLENFYYFFDARKHLGQAIEKIGCSAYVDFKSVSIDQILWPELRDCENISVANKHGNDAVYFSGVNVDQLLFFLKRLTFPPAIVGFVEENRTALDHLLFDIGFDYVVQGDELRIVKSGYYGVF